MDPEGYLREQHRQQDELKMMDECSDTTKGALEQSDKR